MSSPNESESRPPRRNYRLGARAKAFQQTRMTILRVAAEELFNERWYDEVSLTDVARAAGVSQQTVINHFGSKEGLYLAGIVELIGPEIERYRSRARPGELTSIINTAVGDYEKTGLGAMRMRAQAERSDGVAEAVRYGRQFHRAWIEKVFAPQLASAGTDRAPVVAGLLVTILDVATWHQLRYLDGRSVTRTKSDLRHLIEGVLTRAGQP
ncbi:TetR/AcrR family transcriptional regulator [Microlunatus sp. Gsoil 973]|uniref:TetR/AcrR family transcriptional regulator n=1 Tax=Microlunatus sp. Gsoil 973 TaxID=2672569 RepID=UPI0012B44F6F|nr:TetR/AcrR family transcriptional regulator [Microlunatus sp. Gsoil 973]QGN32269.1 TetR family transcriptional regulator [Microlunatus sp. Gsoil 973]